jgi:acylphosphatase
MADAEGMACRRWTLSGRVQGVGFRWFVLNNAQALGIRGWVSNTWDGGVEVVALASRETIDAFGALLEKGPPAARVTQITNEDIPLDIVESKSFIIKH